VRRAWPRTADQ